MALPRFVPSLIHRGCEFCGFDCAARRVRYPVFQMLAFGSPDVGIAKTGSVWVLVPLPASHHVADLILVPSSG
jgi:hypothetical protein